MPVTLPAPYTLDIEKTEEVPNIYIVGLGAGYLSSRYGDYIAADSNVFNTFLSQFMNKTGLMLNKSMFGHTIFRRAFLETLAAMYNAYSNSRTLYLSNQRKVPDEDLGRYITLDDFTLMAHFVTDSVSELEKVIEKNKDILEAERTLLKKYLPMNQTKDNQDQGQQQG